MRNSVITLILIILFSSHFFSYAQPNPIWIHYVIPEFVMDITEDSTDIWVGTYKAGIVKINKSTGIETYLNMSNSDIPFNEIHTLYMASNGTLYIGGNYCFATFNGSSWTNYNTQNSNLGSIGYTRDICEDYQGNIWFGSDFDGFRKFDGTSFTKYFTNLSVSSLCIDTNNRIWVSSTYSSGLLAINNQGSHYQSFSSISNACIPSSFITRVKTDIQNRTWLCSNDEFLGRNGGLSYIQNGICNTVQDTSYNTFAYCNDLDFDTSGNVYVATSNRGIVKYDGNTFYYLDYDSLGIPSSSINQIYIDDDNNMWFSTNKGGFYKYQNSVLDSFQIDTCFLPSNIWTSIMITSNNQKHLQFLEQTQPFNAYSRYVITNIDTNTYSSHGAYLDYFENSNGHLWVGTSYGLFEIYDTNEIFHPYSSSFNSYTRYSNKICKGLNNSIWVGTNYGLYTFDGQTWSSMISTPSTTKNVSGLYYDINTNLLYASFSDNQGVFKYDGNQWSLIPLSINSNIIDIFPDKLGQIWVFTRDEGFSQLDPFSLQETHHQINDDNIRASCVSNTNTIFACSPNALYKFNGQYWDTLKVNTSGYPYVEPRDIEADQYGNIWIVGNNGIAIYNEQGIILNLDEIIQSKDNIEYFHVYPNPSKDNITLLIDENYKKIQLNLYSNDGKLILKKQLGSNRSNKVMINLGMLKPGLYLLNLVTESTTISKKLIIQN